MSNCFLLSISGCFCCWPFLLSYFLKLQEKKKKPNDKVNFRLLTAPQKYLALRNFFIISLLQKAAKKEDFKWKKKKYNMHNYNWQNFSPLCFLAAQLLLLTFLSLIKVNWLSLTNQMWKKKKWKGKRKRDLVHPFAK